MYRHSFQKYIYLLLIFFVGCDNLFDTQNIDLTSDKIEILGCLHVKRFSDKILMSRFNEINLQNADFNVTLHGQNQAGVIIRFKTNSNYVKIKFDETVGVHEGIEYGVWCDGVWYKYFSSHNFILYKPKGKDFATWEITPSLYNSVCLSKIEINYNAQIIRNSIPRLPKYFAFGNSITHGNGQENASYRSYPFILGKKLGYETFNLAAGGSKVCSQVSAELQGQNAHLITILWGFNDWYFYSETAIIYRRNMLELIRNIRLYQPKTPLICISLIGTEMPVPPSGIKIDEYRVVLEQIVFEMKSSGDENIFLLDGAKVNVELVDKIHPSVKGSEKIAEILELFIKENSISNYN